MGVMDKFLNYMKLNPDDDDEYVDDDYYDDDDEHLKRQFFPERIRNRKADRSKRLLPIK